MAAMRHVVILFSLLTVLATKAQVDVCPDSACQKQWACRGYDRESATMIGVGQTTQWDTYLSNERYHGPSLTILSQKSRPTHWLDRRLYVQHLTFGNFSYAKPRSDKHKTLSGFFHWQVVWHYHFLKADGQNLAPTDEWRQGSSLWELNAGAGIQTNAGFVYNTLGGNNPASGRLSLHLLGSGQARYHFRWGKQRFTTSLQADIPLVGLFFSPDYGQSYYEIFSLGHYHHNICFANPLRALQANVLLALDWHLKPTTSLRLGYSGQFMQSHANGLKTQDLSNYFIIGYVRRF